MKRLPSVVLSASLLATGCGAPLIAERERPPGVVLAHLESRDQRLTIYGGTGAAPCFTVTAHDGRVLGQTLSLDDLKARHPELSRLYETSFARRAVLLAQ